MKKYSYQKFVDRKNIEIIKDEQNLRLFKLSVPLNFEGNKVALVITRSPLNYNQDGSSQIIYRSLRYIKSKIYDEFYGVSRVDFVFLFPVSNFNDEYLGEYLETYGEKFLIGNDGFFDSNGTIVKNDEIIFYSMMEADKIILAWGDIPKNIKEIGNEWVRYILKGYKMIKNNNADIKETFRIGFMTQNGSPKHCLNWRESDIVYKYEV